MLDLVAKTSAQGLEYGERCREKMHPLTISPAQKQPFNPKHQKHAPASDFIKLGLLLQKFLTDCAVHADQNSPSFFLVRRRPQVPHRINLSGSVRFGVHKDEAPLTGDRHAADLHLHLEPSDASVERIDHKRVCVGLECRFIAC